MSWNKKRGVGIGAARQGLALTRYLAENGAEVVLTDARSEDYLAQVRQVLAGLPVEWVLGDHPLNLLDGADMVCPSGGVPLTIPFIQEAIWRGIQLSNDSQIFMDAVQCPVVGITGSAGKTTTTTLMGRIAEQAVKAGIYNKSYVGGNIGLPLISLVEEMTADDLAVVEFSSFQLDLMTSSPQVATILNVTPNHLDRHGTMAAYINAKKNIFAYQEPGDTLILGHDDPQAWSFAPEAPGKLIAFGRELPEGQLGTYLHQEQIWLRTSEGEIPVMPIEEVALRGAHNLLNVLAACALSAALDLPTQVMRTGVQGFGGVEHRLEFIGELGGVQWYNDSKATSPGMTVTAMQAFSEPLIVLAGGRDKALPWDGFAAQAEKQARKVIAFGEAAEIVLAAYPQAAVCEGLDQAVALAAELAVPGDVVLLAPGGTSFDEFVDYEARGRRFKALVQSMKE